MVHVWGSRQPAVHPAVCSLPGARALVGGGLVKPLGLPATEAPSCPPLALLLLAGWCHAAASAGAMSEFPTLPNLLPGELEWIRVASM